MQCTICATYTLFKAHFVHCTICEKYSLFKAHFVQYTICAKQSVCKLSTPFQPQRIGIQYEPAAKIIAYFTWSLYVGFHLIFVNRNLFWNQRLITYLATLALLAGWLKIFNAGNFSEFSQCTSSSVNARPATSPLTSPPLRHYSTTTGLHNFWLAS